MSIGKCHQEPYVVGYLLRLDKKDCHETMLDLSGHKNKADGASCALQRR
jgi:hypothetical protein